MDDFAPDKFIRDIWYFVGLLSDLKDGGVKALSLAGEPIVLARDGDTVFALRDAPIMDGDLALQMGRAKRYPPCQQTPTCKLSGLACAHIPSSKQDC